MSFSKAHDLLRLADMAAARYRGVTLEDIAAEFAVSHRTAQRMSQALEAAFPNATDRLVDPDGRARWAFRESALARMRLSGDAELAALELAIARLRRDGDERPAETLASLRDRLMAALPERTARRLEAEAEAMLAAHGLAVRPGPAPQVSREVTEAVVEALRGPWVLEFSYRGEQRRVEPYGILLGARRYLVARQPNRGAAMRQFRLDLVEDPVVTPEWFARDPTFDLAAYAGRAFGSFQTDEEYGEVVWVFAARAADRAAEWRFHPGQTARRLTDGRLEVRFTAAGWLEMAWHLYCWGDAVEVVAPGALRDMVAAHRRSDFGALP